MVSPPPGDGGFGGQRPPTAREAAEEDTGDLAALVRPGQSL